jgi:hypothetical protein
MLPAQTIPHIGESRSFSMWKSRGLKDGNPGLPTANQDDRPRLDGSGASLHKDRCADCSKKPPRPSGEQGHLSRCQIDAAIAARIQHNIKAWSVSHRLSWGFHSKGPMPCSCTTDLVSSDGRSTWRRVAGDVFQTRDFHMLKLRVSPMCGMVCAGTVVSERRSEDTEDTH